MKVQAIWEDGAVRLGLMAETMQERKLLDALPTNVLRSWKDQYGGHYGFNYPKDERVTGLWVELGHAPDTPAEVMESE